MKEEKSDRPQLKAEWKNSKGGQIKLIGVVQPQSLVKESRCGPGRIQHPQQTPLRWDIIPEDTEICL